MFFETRNLILHHADQPFPKVSGGRDAAVVIAVRGWGEGQHVEDGLVPGTLDALIGLLLIIVAKNGRGRFRHVDVGGAILCHELVRRYNNLIDWPLSCKEIPEAATLQRCDEVRINLVLGVIRGHREDEFSRGDVQIGDNGGFEFGGTFG